MSKDEEIAAWMMKCLAEDRFVYQDVIAPEIEKQFGTEYIYYNANGNVAISKNVLRAFEKISPNVVWNRSERYWRFRESFDAPGRQQ